MAWKARGGRAYCYRSERVGGRVVSRYVGMGVDLATAEKFRRVEAMDREAEALERGDLRDGLEAARAARERVERLIGGGLERAVGWAEAAIVAAGYYRHDRGRWRRRGMIATMPATIPEALAPGEHIGGLTPDESAAMLAARLDGDPVALAEAKADAEWERAKALLTRASVGDPSAVPALRAMIEAKPEMFSGGGNPTRLAIDQLCNLMAGKGDLAIREVYAVRVGRKRDELAGPNPSPIVSTLAERAALCWLDSSIMDAIFAERVGTGVGVNLAKFYDKTRDRSHRRFLLAIKVLADVKRLAGPRTGPAKAVPV